MSKKIIFLAVFTAGLLFSCQKENIVPGQHVSILTEETATRGQVTNGNMDTDTDDMTTEIRNLDVVRDENITDPNNDEDRNKKKKGTH